MLNKLTLLTATVFAMTMGVANAAESVTKAPATTNAIELTETEMDTVSAGYYGYYYGYYYNNTASADSNSIALGRYSIANTSTFTGTGSGGSASASSAYAYSRN